MATATGLHGFILVLWCDSKYVISRGTQPTAAVAFPGSHQALPHELHVNPGNLDRCIIDVFPPCSAVPLRLLRPHCCPWVSCSGGSSVVCNATSILCCPVTRKCDTILIPILCVGKNKQTMNYSYKTILKHLQVFLRRAIKLEKCSGTVSEKSSNCSPQKLTSS